MFYEAMAFFGRMLDLDLLLLKMVLTLTFTQTDCQDVLAAITINGGCEAPLLGPASSGKLVGC